MAMQRKGKEVKKEEREGKILFVTYIIQNEYSRRGFDSSGYLILSTSLIPYDDIFSILLYIHQHYLQATIIQKRSERSYGRKIR
jgi:hypothetical protein